ncbi:MAG: 4Fe-4S double cluster binding domain-containing protein [Candidatus Izemoplasmatales bacterium]
MRIEEIYKLFKKKFDLVGIIDSKSYYQKAISLDKDAVKPPFSTMVVLGLAYPKHIIKSSDEFAVPSFYTFGKDYHIVMKDMINDIVKDFDFNYYVGVDNHPYNERLAASLAGLGFLGKNQLIINSQYGSYFFIGIVFIDINLKNQFTNDVIDDCGECRKCIEACPTNALTDSGYNLLKCISFFNQEKKVLTNDEIQKNYCLFGCDICQLACPKNIDKGMLIHPEFQLSGKEKVKIDDLFRLSNKDFINKYKDMAYLWKGKTILMRNALTLLLNSNNQKYNDLIEKSILNTSSSWYKETAKQILDELTKSSNL